MVDNKDSKGLLGSLRKFEVSAGDGACSSRTPHAIDAGIFLLELQEPTDLSALLNGKVLPLTV